MRHPLAERLRLAPFRIHVVRVKVARLACVKHYICLSDGSPHGLSRWPGCKVFEE
jgi:hypothetical protein